MLGTHNRSSSCSSFHSNCWSPRHEKERKEEEEEEVEEVEEEEVEEVEEEEGVEEVEEEVEEVAEAPASEWSVSYSGDLSSLDPGAGILCGSCSDCLRDHPTEVTEGHMTQM
ncbi:unnamed protein product [Boreogadus saida]